MGNGSRSGLRCPAVGKGDGKWDRDGWGTERSYDGHSTGPPTPEQPVGPAQDRAHIADMVRMALRDVLPEVLGQGV